MLREDLPVLEDFEWCLRLLQATSGLAIDETLVESKTLEDGLSQRFDLRTDALGKIIHTHGYLLSKHPDAAHLLLYEYAKSLSLQGRRHQALRALIKAISAQPFKLKLYFAVPVILIGGRFLDSIRRLRIGQRLRQKTT